MREMFFADIVQGNISLTEYYLDSLPISNSEKKTILKFFKKISFLAVSVSLWR